MSPLSFRLAARELRSGVRGFGIFLACLALGVAAIASASSTAEAFRRGLASQSRESWAATSPSRSRTATSRRLNAPPLPSSARSPTRPASA